MSVGGGSNAEVTDAADVVVVAVPFEGHAGTLVPLAGALAGKVVVHCVVPMGFDERGAFVPDVPDGSVTEQAAPLLPDSQVAGAFHHISAVLLLDLSKPSLDTDVLVVGDARQATDTVQALLNRLPRMRGSYAGRLRNARQVEALTVDLVSINRRYEAPPASGSPTSDATDHESHVHPPCRRCRRSPRCAVRSSAPSGGGDYAITADIYSHVAPEQRRDAADRLDEALEW